MVSDDKCFFKVIILVAETEKLISTELNVFCSFLQHEFLKMIWCLQKTKQFDF